MTIEKRGRRYVVLSEKKTSKGKRKQLGTYSTREAAAERLRQVEAAKHAKGG